MKDNKISDYQKALNVWAIILIIWSVYRAKFRMPEWFDEFIAKPLVFVLPVYYYITKKEKKNFLNEIYFNTKKIASDVILGIGVGGLFLFSAIIANYLKYRKIFVFSRGLDLKSLMIILAIALATGISEEILSRGFVLKRLYDESKNIVSASFFASILFFFLHVPILFTNQRINGSTLLMFMAADMILSLANSYLFIERKSLVLPILIHAFYNVATILFI
jgi:membrane protease YdiL (CAAX protease family)